MAKPNYQFGKRKRDMEKKAKKEERRLRKLDPQKPAGETSEDGTTPTEPAAEGDAAEAKPAEA